MRVSVTTLLACFFLLTLYQALGYTLGRGRGGRYKYEGVSSHGEEASTVHQLPSQI